MNTDSFDIYELSPEKEIELWKDSIIVFDSSALIDFYFYPKETRNEIFDLISEKLKGRVWVPFHVQFEYLKNRKSVIEKPILECYDPIISDKLHKLISAKTEIIKTSKIIKENTSKAVRHPYLDQKIIDEFIEYTSEIESKVSQFEKDLKAAIDEKVMEIKSLKSNDTILKSFAELIEVGPELTYSEIMDIVNEGKIRYEFEIPPGYMDKKEKSGIQIFGDLIIWKQILTYSKTEDKNIIFICNDLKIDWCYKGSRSRIERPREELIKEFKDNSGKLFWMYDQSQFIYKSNEILKSNIDSNKIEEISKIISDKNDNFLIYKCNNCQLSNIVLSNDLNFDFECISSSNRGMGPENHYQSIENHKCANCKMDIEIKFNIWEYPTGVHNYSNMQIEGGEIIQIPDYVGHFWDYYFYEPHPDEDDYMNR